MNIKKDYILSSILPPYVKEFISTICSEFHNFELVQVTTKSYILCRYPIVNIKLTRKPNTKSFIFLHETTKISLKEIITTQITKTYFLYLLVLRSNIGQQPYEFFRMVHHCVSWSAGHNSIQITDYSCGVLPYLIQSTTQQDTYNSVGQHTFLTLI